MIEQILQNLTTQYIGHNIKYFDEIDSTNTYAKQLIKQNVPEGTLVLSNIQTQGKGRLGRAWVSAADVGIWMSLVLYPKLKPEEISALTLVAGLAMCQSLRDITNLNIKLKWPNDLVLNRKKICGILSELIIGENDEVAVVVGIGVNVNTPKFNKSLPFASSLFIESERQFNRADIIVNFLSEFEHLYELYNTQRNFSSFINMYEKLCLNIGEDVYIQNNDDKYIGHVISLTEKGNLLVKKKDGNFEEIFSGEVSIRGVGDYV
ncbi:MAG: biotin--[acetyl-CoA-carboxylase] ligase [Epulopiscium sp. Nuni2H_MBin001]|nr:MAG: biotin--[acetyl-CoA-carboxylase] ligase [Epulopiscium sp. Nuni2H_MBin001]